MKRTCFYDNTQPKNNFQFRDAEICAGGAFSERGEREHRVSLVVIAEQS